MKKRVAILPGDGIGPEVVAQAVKVLQAIAYKFDHEFDLIYGEIGACSIDRNETPLTDETLELCERSDAILLGAIGDPKYDNDPTLKVRPEQGLLKLRKALKLGTNIRPINTYSQLFEASPLKSNKLENVDFVIFRELTGGIYFGEKKLAEDGRSASDLCSYSVEEITSITKQAFLAASQRKKKLTLVDKANVLETSRLWRKVVQEIAAEYPDVVVDFQFVDNAAMQVMLDPSQFDVILTENMFGDIISDLASVITGSLGMLPSASLGELTALFEPCHGSYPQAAGKDIANPMATVLSAAMMLDHFKMYDEADQIREAINWAFESGLVTADIDSDNPVCCSKLGDLLAYRIEEGDGCKMKEKKVAELGLY